ALSCFCASLERIGSHLVFLKASGEGNEVGSSLQTLKVLAKETGAQTVMANALYEPWLKERDDVVFSSLQKEGFECQMFHSYCLRNPFSVSTEGVGLRGVVLGQTYPERIVTDLEERRSKSLQDVALVRKQFPQYVDKRSGCDLVPLPKRLVSEALGLSHWDGVVLREEKQFLLPVITRMEFKHQLEDPDADAASNPYNAVLKGYVSRKRDETIAFLNERDFTASVMYEGAQRQERLEKDYRRMEGLHPSPSPRRRVRRTPTAKDKFSIVPSGAVASMR
ncbi:hypothetical protein XENOCAPTIV_005702, partial [Xenoophorus captivus]